MLLTQRKTSAQADKKIHNNAMPADTHNDFLRKSAADTRKKILQGNFLLVNKANDLNLKGFYIPGMIKGPAPV